MLNFDPPADEMLAFLQIGMGQRSNELIFKIIRYDGAEQQAKERRNMVHNCAPHIRGREQYTDRLFHKKEYHKSFPSNASLYSPD